MITKATVAPNQSLELPFAWSHPDHRNMLNHNRLDLGVTALITVTACLAKNQTDNTYAKDCNIRHYIIDEARSRDWCELR
jgi:hypothetical protein